MIRIKYKANGKDKTIIGNTMTKSKRFVMLTCPMETKIVKHMIDKACIIKIEHVKNPYGDYEVIKDITNEL